MLKKHSLGHTCNESKGLCPECKCKHYVNDTVCDFMVSFSTYKGIVDVGWNLDECGSDKACLANVEKAFRKAGVVHIPLDDVNKDMISANKALISLLKTEHSSEYNAELKRLRDERERLALAEKKKDAEISQNITRLKEEAKAREQNMSRISEAIKADRMNRQRDTTNTLQKGKGAIVYGSGISNNVASMKDLFSTSDPNKVIAPDGTVELKPPPPKSNKPAAAVRTHFATTTTAIVPGTWGDPEAVISSLDEKKMSNPDYVDALVARACEDKEFYHAIEMHVENPFCAFIYLQTFTKMRDNPPPPPPSLAERPLITRRPERTGHVLDDDSASASASVSGGTVFSYAKHATATPAGDPPRKEQSSPVPQQQQQQPSPPLQIQNTGPCGEQFTNDSSVPCIVAKVSHNGRSETIKINKTATMKQFYLHVAWLFKGALPEGFRLVFSRIPKGCTYEKGVLPSDSDDTVEVLNKNLINVIS